MGVGMKSFHAHNSCRALAGVCTMIVLVVTPPAGATAAGTTSQRTIAGIPIPASVHVTGSTATATTAAPASGAQPGTVAPGATPSSATPTTSVPTTAAPPAATTPTTTAPSTTNPITTTPTTPGAPTVVGVARKTTSQSNHISTGALALAILGALLALGCAVWVVGRWLALEPRWTISMMHSLREATYHASATWAEFSDWARIGR